MTPEPDVPEPGEDLGPWIELSVQGDRDAMQQLLLSQVESLTAFVQRQIPADLNRLMCAEDIVQQTFVKAFKAIHRFEGASTAAFAGWLRTIARNQLMDYLRRRNRERLQDVKQPGEGKQDDAGDRGAWLRLSQMMDRQGETPSQSAMQAELSRAVQVALAGMSPDYREAIVLKYLQGRSIAEVAELMGRSEDAVRGLCHRARKQLKAELVRLSRFQ